MKLAFLFLDGDICIYNKSYNKIFIKQEIDMYIFPYQFLADLTGIKHTCSESTY